MSGGGSVVDKWIQGVFEHAPMQIFVKMVTGKTITLDVEKDYMLDDIKVLIKHKVGVDPREQLLGYQGRVLNQHRTLAEFGINNGAALGLSLQLRGGGGGKGGKGDSFEHVTTIYNIVNNNNGFTIGRGNELHSHARRYGYRGPVSVLVRLLIEDGAPISMRVEAYEHFYMLTRNQQSPLLDTFRTDLNMLNYMEESSGEEDNEEDNEEGNNDNNDIPDNPDNDAVVIRNVPDLVDGPDLVDVRAIEARMIGIMERIETDAMMVLDLMPDKFDTA